MLQDKINALADALLNLRTDRPKPKSKRALAWSKPLDITAVTFDSSTIPGYIDLNVTVSGKAAVAHLSLAEAKALKTLLNLELANLKGTK